MIRIQGENPMERKAYLHGLRKVWKRYRDCYFTRISFKEGVEILPNKISFK